MNEELLPCAIGNQREKRLNMLFHLPCVSGKNRHCDPERNIHKQALINYLQVSGCPIWIPVNFFKFANIRIHSSSLKFIRFMLPKMTNSTRVAKHQQNLAI